MKAPWQPSSLRADVSLGAAAIAVVDDRYGHSIEVAAVRLQVHQPQPHDVRAFLILCL